MQDFNKVMRRIAKAWVLGDDQGMYPFRVAERVEYEVGEWHKRLVSEVRHAWLKTKFVCGAWRGVMVHANSGAR